MSRNTAGVAADDASTESTISSQGGDVAFSSVATNLDPGAASAIGPQVYVHTLATRATQWVSLAALGEPNAVDARSPVLSEFGQFIAFEQVFATVPPTYSIVFRDLDATTPSFETIIDTGTTPVQDPTMSWDGRWVAFATEAALLPEDTDAVSDVYLRDRQTGELSFLSSQATDGAAALRPRLSLDGQTIAFEVEGGSGSSGTIVTDVEGVQFSVFLGGDRPVIAADGRKVAFRDTWPGVDRIFVDGLLWGPLEEVSIDSLGNPTTSDCDDPVISPDGQSVAFRCLGPMTNHGATDQVYVRDLVAGTTKLASINETGAIANDTDSRPTAMTINGDVLIVEASADNLGTVPGGFPQVFRIPVSYWEESGSTCAADDTTCDGVDDDCDGQTDEDYVSQPTVCGVGACGSTGATSCVGGVEQDSCVPLVGGPEGTVCNGIDDDCDGFTDEDYVDVPSICGFGPCESTGLLTCQSGVVVDTCVPGSPGATNDPTCDGVDDDCDGEVDEDCICVPMTCRDYPVDCGTVDDGCGTPLDCGVCEGLDTCGGGGIPNVCGTPVPPDPVDVAPAEDVGRGGLLQSFAFLTEGAAPIQIGVAPDAIVPQRAAIVRGRVTTHDGVPLSGVKITVKRDPSLGQTVSRSDGRYDLLVNGGGNLTLEFTSLGYLPLQRDVRVPWEGFAQMEPVAMTVESDVSTYVVFDSSSQDPQVAVGRTVQDGDGQREVVGFLPAGLTAIDETGGASESISDGVLRMTEYTVGAAGPKAMPAVLPENSRYTFAVDISLDDQGPMASVRFDTTAFFYVDNFLGLPVGAIVPNGRYDYETSRWVAERDGLVMEVVAVVDGLAEINATYGDSDPEDQMALLNLEMSDRERAELATRYPPGASFWRMPVDHLSPYDWNYNGAEPNPPPSEPEPRDEPTEPEDGDCEKGSIIYCQARALAEEVPISGTPFFLRYDSTRARANAGAGRIAVIPLPTDPPSAATELRVQASVLGRELLDETLTLPLSSSTRSVVWDGLDAYGRPWLGSAELEYQISYTFEPMYQVAITGTVGPQEARTFGVPVCDVGDDCCVRVGSGGGTGVLPVPGRSVEVSSTGYEGTVLLASVGADRFRFGGWSVSDYHAYDTTANKLYLGTGETLNLTPSGVDGRVVAGLASNGDAADDLPTSVPIENDITEPRVVAASPDGAVYFSGSVPGVNPIQQRRLWRMSTTGELEWITNDFCNRIHDLDVSPEGVLHVLCKIPEGIYKVVEEGPDQWSSEVIVQANPAAPWWQDGESLNGTRFRPEFMAFRDDGTLFFTVVSGSEHGVSDRNQELIEYNTNGTGRIVGVDTGTRIAAGPGNTIVTVALGALVEISPSGVATTLASNTGHDGDLTWIDDFEWHSTATHSFIGGRTTTYRITTSPNGDVFIARPTSPPNDCGVNDKFLFQVSRGRIRAVQLDYLPDPEFGPPCYRLNHLTTGPTGIYVADRHVHMIAELASTGVTPDSSGAIEVPSPDGSEIYRFSEDGLHVSTRDALTGAPLYTFAHSDGRLSAISDRDGRTTRFDRPDSNTILVTAPGGPGAIAGSQTVLEVSSQSGFLESISHPQERRWSFEYSDDGLLEKLWDPRGNEGGLKAGAPYVFEYEQFKNDAASAPDADARWLLKKDTDPAGGSQTLALSHTRELEPIYDTWCNGEQYVKGYSVINATSEVTKTSSLNRQVRFTTTQSTGSPVITTKTQPTGWYVTRSNPDGEDTIRMEWPGGSSSYTMAPHPTLGPEVEVLNTTSTSYSAVPTHGQLLLDTAHDWSSAFQATTSGLPQPDAHTVTSTFTPSGVGGAPREYTSTYDAVTRSITLTSTTTGRATAYYLDENSRIERIERPGQVPTIYTYDANGFPYRVLRTKGSQTRVTEFGFDSQGYINSLKNKVNNSVTDEIAMQNDLAGFTRQITVPGLLTVGTSPDVAGALSTVTPDGKPTHGVSYSPLGHPAQYASPAGALSTDGTCPAGTQCWRYSVDRELDYIILPDGSVIDYAYDPVSGTLVSVDVPGHGATTFEYDAQGRHEFATAPTGGTVAFAWQSMLPIRTTWSGDHVIPGVGTVALNGSVERFYNDFLETAELHVTAGKAVRYLRDTDGFVTDIEDVAGLLPTLTLSRSPLDGHITGTSLGEVTTTHVRDVRSTIPGFGELESVNAVVGTTDLYSASYTRDDRGRVHTWTQSVQGAPALTRKFAYDGAGRLLTVHDITGGEPGTLIEEYEYDGNGNREKAFSNYAGAVALDTELGTGIGCDGGAGGAGGAGGPTAANDQDQLCSYGGFDYRYNTRGQLEERDDGTVVRTYTYDGAGHLKRVTEDGLDVRYVHDALGRRIGKIRGGTLEKGWLYNGLNPVAQLDSAGNVEATFIYGSRANVPDAMVMTDGTMYRFITDHLGSVRLVVNVETEQVVQRLDYDSFGRVLRDDSPGFQPFGFAGGLYDDDTGLVRFGTRDYDAYAGRWTTKDPALFRGGTTNLYAYSVNDPVNFVDPTGLFPLSECEQERLQPFFPDIDLQDVDIQVGLPPFADLLITPQALTIGNTIFIDQPYADYGMSRGGLALIGHELQHVQQFQEVGAATFLIEYALGAIRGFLETWDVDEAYRAIPAEVEAYDIQAEIYKQLRLEYGANAACPNECE